MIAVEDLSFTYPEALESALCNISFSVDQTEIFGLLGPSGAGKSTLVNVLTGLLHGYSGSLQILGDTPAARGPAFYEDVGISFEFPNHFAKLTARENLDYFRALYTTKTRSALEALDLVGLKEHAEKKVDALSKGMKNRLTLARSLLHHPKLLFLDEPTSGLDPVSARHVRQLVHTLRSAGTTVLLTTHNMMDADELCDRVGFIVEGELVALDSPSAFAQRYGRRAVRVEYAPSAEHAHDLDGGGADMEENEADVLLSKEFPLDGLGENVEFLNLLKRESIKRIHSQETTLEEVFVQVTGKALK